MPVSLSTIADAVGACCVVLNPLLRLLEAHVMAAERLHGDDKPVPVLALGKCDVGRCWVYVRDDKPFGGTDPPAAMFYYSRDRGGAHPQLHLAGYSCILQADAFSGYAKLYEPQRSLGSIQEAACWVQARRPIFTMADLEENARRKAAGKKDIEISLFAMDIVRRIDALFEIERTINGKSPGEHKAVRQGRTVRRWSPICTPIWKPSAPSSCAAMISPSAGSGASSSAAAHGCSVDPTGAVNARRRCTA